MYPWTMQQLIKEEGVSIHLQGEQVGVPLDDVVVYEEEGLSVHLQDEQVDVTLDDVVVDEEEDVGVHRGQ